MDLLVQKQVDGVLLVPTGDQAKLAATLRMRNIPVVVIDRDVPDAPIDRAHIDNVAGGYLATRHSARPRPPPHRLHRRPAASQPRTRSQRRLLPRPARGRLAHRRTTRRRRQLSRCRRLQRGAGPARPAPIRPPPSLPATTSWPSAPSPPPATPALPCPIDLSIVGFDDIHLAGYINPPLTTVAQPKYELGVVAAQLLFERLAQPDLPPQCRLLQAQLVVRQSTAVCRAAPDAARSS